MSDPSDLELQPAMSLLYLLKDEELSNIVNDEEQLNKFISSLDIMDNWKEKKSMLMAQNCSIAEYNLQFEPKLAQKKAELMELYQKGRNLVEELEVKRLELDSLQSSNCLENIYADLESLARAKEQNSEALADEFLEGKMDIDIFLKQYTAQKSEAHILKLKSEKMREIVYQQRNRPSFSGLPYPSLSSNMPMPGV